MDIDVLKTAVVKVVGVKQTAKALQKKTAQVVFVAADADERLTLPIRQESERQGIACVLAVSMHELGKAAGIHSGASAAAILKY